MNGGGKKLSNPKTQNFRNPFRLKKGKKGIKDRIIRDVRTLFEHEEEDYYKPKRVSNSGIIIILNMKVMVIKIETYH